MLTNEGTRFSIMVDCGDYNDGVKDYVRNTLENTIDLLVITHIDNDHISGIKEMLRSEGHPKVGQIIYNCSQLTKVTDKELPPTCKEVVANLKNKCKSKSRKKKISAYEALSLAEIIAESDEYKTAWQKQQEYVTEAYRHIVLPDGFGKLVFLSPKNEDISRLDKKFKTEFVRKFYMNYEGPYDGESEIYELIIAGLARDVRSLRRVSTSSCSVKSIKAAAIDEIDSNISPENRASISFLWECGEKRVLFCGDGAPETIVFNFLRNYSLPAGERAFFEAIKVPHHGSAHNCGNNFWDTFDSRHIFITGTSRDNARPSKQCLSKIVTRDTDFTRTIHYTASNGTIEWFNSDEEVKKLLKYQMTYDCEYGFDYQE